MTEMSFLCGLFFLFLKHPNRKINGLLLSLQILAAVQLSLACDQTALLELSSDDSDVNANERGGAKTILFRCEGTFAKGGPAEYSSGVIHQVLILKHQGWGQLLCDCN